MEFGEKIKQLRKENNLTQEELAKAVGLSARAIQSYEQKNVKPRKIEIYKKLADVLGVDISVLMTDEEEFVVKAQEKYGSRGARDAEELVSRISGLFAGGEVSEEAKDEVMQAIQNAYWIAKKNNVKYTPKKYRKEE
mgnify:CR=1 FL=1